MIMLHGIIVAYINKMKILFLNNNRFIKHELQEFISDIKGKVYFAATHDEAVTILNYYPIDVFFMELKGLIEIGLIKYAHDNFKNIRIILIGDREIENAISAIKNSSFSFIQQPFGLKELRHILSDNDFKIS